MSADQIPAGEIRDGFSVTQVFRAPKDFLSGVSIVLATYARRNDCGLLAQMFELEPSTELHEIRVTRKIKEQVFGAADVHDNANHEVYFSPIADSRDRVFAFQLSSPDASQGNASTAWLRRGFGKDRGYLFSRSGYLVQPDFGVLSEPLYSPPTTDSEVPPGLLLSPITQCNLNCVHCISRSTRSRFQKWDSSIRERIKEWCKTGKVQSVATDYSGDLLFADHRYGGELDFLIDLDVPFHMDTNGIFLTRQAAEKLVGSRARSINVSLDAGTDLTYRRIRRGSPPLSEVLANMSQLSRLRRQARRYDDLRLSIGFTLMRSNLDELETVLELASDTGFDGVQCRHLEAYTPDMDEESLVHFRDDFNLARLKALDVSRGIGIGLNIPEPFADGPETTGHLPCPEPWRSAVILGNGDVQVCCIPKTAVGNLHRNSMEEIWNGRVYQEIRKAVNSDRPPPQCAACPINRKANNVDSYLPHRVMDTWKPLSSLYGATNRVQRIKQAF